MRACAVILFVLASAGRAHAFGDDDRFSVGQIVHGGNWNPRPTATKRLAWEIDRRTSIDSVQAPVAVRWSDERALRQHPFLYLTGDGAFPAPDEADVARLRRHIVAGGFLLIDSSEARPGGGFDQSARALIKRIFPREPMQRLPEDHVVFKSFYLLTVPVGRVAQVPFLEAVIHDGRAAIVYTQNDLGGAWARNDLGQWEHSVYPGGERQREMAFRLGINLAMYALCLDYKTDQVHVPFILKRRQWR